MRRTFFALELDDDFLERTLAFADALRAGADAARLRPRWLARGALHVTARFVGPTDDAQVPALAALVPSLGVGLRAPIEVPTTSLLAFPDPRRARVLALHLDDGGACAEVAAALERELCALGIPPETRAFRPHLTLARIREPHDVRRVFDACYAPRPNGRLVALTYFESVLGPKGPVHSPLARHVLGDERA